MDFRPPPSKTFLANCFPRTSGCDNSVTRDRQNIHKDDGRLKRTAIVIRSTSTFFDRREVSACLAKDSMSVQYPGESMYSQHRVISRIRLSIIITTTTVCVLRVQDWRRRRLAGPPLYYIIIIIRSRISMKIASFSGDHRQCFPSV